MAKKKGDFAANHSAAKKDVGAELDHIRDLINSHGDLMIGDRCGSDQEEATIRAEMKRATDFVEAMRGMLSDAFDFGFKAAGGSMIPDGARDMVELALDRDTIDALADVAEYVTNPHGEVFVGDSFERDRAKLNQFLENINIYRRKGR